MKNWKWILFGLGGLLVPAAASAVYGTTDFNLYMYKSYQNSHDCPSFGTQWTNWDDWLDEMLDISVAYNQVKNSTVLIQDLAGPTRSRGYNADIVVVDTHGYDEYDVSGNHQGYFADESCTQPYGPINYAEPTNDEAEIMAMSVCQLYNKGQADNWHSFRNLHHYGMPVSVGCWDLCGTYTDLFSSTYNEFGDQIADVHATIKNGWRDAFASSGHDEDIFVQGLGQLGPGNCDDTALDTTFQNRGSHHGPTYGRDAPYAYYSSDPEMCGYYWTNLCVSARDRASDRALPARLYAREEAPDVTRNGTSCLCAAAWFGAGLRRRCTESVRAVSMPACWVRLGWQRRLLRC